MLSNLITSYGLCLCFFILGTCRSSQSGLMRPHEVQEYFEQLASDIFPDFEKNLDGFSLMELQRSVGGSKIQGEGFEFRLPRVKRTVLADPVHTYELWQGAMGELKKNRGSSLPHDPEASIPSALRAYEIGIKAGASGGETPHVEETASHLHRSLEDMLDYLDVRLPSGHKRNFLMEVSKWWDGEYKKATEKNSPSELPLRVTSSLLKGIAGHYDFSEREGDVRWKGGNEASGSTGVHRLETSFYQNLADSVSRGEVREHDVGVGADKGRWVESQSLRQFDMAYNSRHGLSEAAVLSALNEEESG